MSVLVVILLCATACRKPSDSAKPEGSAVSETQTAKPAQNPAPAAPEPQWQTRTALDLVTFQAPKGADWTYSFDVAWHGSLDGPEAVFVVRSENEMKNLMDSAKAVSKGDTTIAGQQATLHEGTASDWGPIKIWVFKETHPSTGKTVALVVAGHKQAAFQEELDKILTSIKVELVKSE